MIFTLHIFPFTICSWGRVLTLPYHNVFYLHYCYRSRLQCFAVRMNPKIILYRIPSWDHLSGGGGGGVAVGGVDGVGGGVGGDSGGVK